MKRILGLLAAAFLAAAPFQMAMAEDAHVEAAADAAVTTEAAPAVAHEVALKDGTKLSIEGDAAFVVGADGAKTPATDGDHVLADSSVLSVVGGKVVSGMPTFEAEAAAEGAATAEPAAE